MTLSKSQKTIAAVLFLGVAGFIMYYLLFRGESVVPSLPLGGSGSANPIVGQDVLALVEQLKKVSVDPSLFSSPLFSTLKDFTVPITPEARGRTNPFAEIGIESGQRPPPLRTSYSD
jgi:hypothetical protein